MNNKNKQINSLKKFTLINLNKNHSQHMIFENYTKKKILILN